MKIVARHDHKGAISILSDKYASELKEIEEAIGNVAIGRNKRSDEKTMMGKMLYSPKEINSMLKDFLYPLGWAMSYHVKNGMQKYREVTLPLTYTIPETGEVCKRTFYMDGLKNRVGLELQFGKYAFVPFDLFVKLPVFRKWGMIEVGIEVIPMRKLTYSKTEGRLMSTGVPVFENIVTEVVARGVADIDCPVLILGVDALVTIPEDELVTEEGISESKLIKAAI
jgi:hypothetical protein